MIDPFTPVGYRMDPQLNVFECTECGRTKEHPRGHAEDCRTGMRELLISVQKLSRDGCFSRKRSERDRALSDINRITEKYK